MQLSDGANGVKLSPHVIIGIAIMRITRPANALLMILLSADACAPDRMNGLAATPTRIASSIAATASVPKLDVTASMNPPICVSQTFPAPPPSGWAATGRTSESVATKTNSIARPIRGILVLLMALNV